jgi:hypothetical protein
MPGYDDHDLERRLREQRSEASEEFVENLSADLRSRRHPSARPRLTLAFALSIALLVSLVAFGGVGAASSALHSSAAVVRSAVGNEPQKARGSQSHSPPAKHQYYEKVVICSPSIRYVRSFTWVTVEKWVWKTEWKNGHKRYYRVKVPVQVKQWDRTKTVEYSADRVSAKNVPELVAKGAVYPVPTGGCSTLNHPTAT